MPSIVERALPITSNHIELTLKLINRRVKGTEKHWDQGAEPLLQLVADHFGDTPDCLRFWKQRTQRLTRISDIRWVEIAQGQARKSQAERGPRVMRLARPTLQNCEKCGRETNRGCQTDA